MAGEIVEAVAVPTEILHDLRGQFHEIPRDVDAIQGFDLHVAQQVMQQVAEFVEDGLHFAVGKQGWLAIDGRGHVAANQAEMRFAVALSGGRGSGFQIVHPCPAAFGIAWMPVGIKRPEVRAQLIVDLVEFDLRMPDLDGVGIDVA